MSAAAEPSDAQRIPAPPVQSPTAPPDTMANIAALVRTAKQAASPKAEPAGSPLPSGRFRVSRSPAPPDSPAVARSQASSAPQTSPEPSAPNPPTGSAAGSAGESSGLSKSSDLPASSDPSEEGGASAGRASPPGAGRLSADVSRRRSAADLPLASASPAAESLSGEQQLTVQRKAADEVGTSDVRANAPREANGQLVRTKIRRDSPGRETVASPPAVADLPIAVRTHRGESGHSALPASSPTGPATELARATTPPASDQPMLAPSEAEIIPAAGGLQAAGDLNEKALPPPLARSSAEPAASEAKSASVPLPLRLTPVQAPSGSLLTRALSSAPRLAPSRQAEPDSSGEGFELPARPVEALGTRTGVRHEAEDSRTGVPAFVATAGPASEASTTQERPAATAGSLALRRAEASPAIRPLAFAPTRPAMVWRTAAPAASLDGASPGGVAGSWSDAARRSEFSATTGGSQLARQAAQPEAASSATPELAAQPATAASPSANRQIDIAELAEQVSKLLGRQLAAERERRGI